MIIVLRIIVVTSQKNVCVENYIRVSLTQVLQLYYM